MNFKTVEGSPPGLTDLLKKGIKAAIRRAREMEEEND